jgi:hypothetical protein
VSNIRIDGRVAHFELGQIPEHAIEMRAATNFLVANYGRQKIIAMPRAVGLLYVYLTMVYLFRKVNRNLYTLLLTAILYSMRSDREQNPSRTSGIPIK